MIELEFLAGDAIGSAERGFYTRPFTSDGATMATFLLLLAVYSLGIFTGGWLALEIKTAPLIDDDI